MIDDKKYYVPSKLLGTNNAKTIKGNKQGYTTYIMYLAPHNQNAFKKNLCAFASKGCASACLFNSGTARFTNVQKGKINKSNYFIANKEGFMKQLYFEILKIVNTHMNMQDEKTLKRNGDVLRYKKFAIRLNGTADIPFEYLKIIGDKNIFELFPSVQFYDYTKNHKRFDKVLPTNYHLTFSRSETNEKKSIELLNRGFNVAFVFGLKPSQDLPKTYLGYKVADGDSDDLRFLDDDNVIVGLKYKILTGKDTFVRNSTKFDSGFVIELPELAPTQMCL